MQTTIKRLRALEARHMATIAGFRGVIECEGRSPLEALQGAEPGLWLILGDGLDFGVMGRVGRSGKRTIVFGEGDHAKH